ncbi:MAG: 5'-methylthioadenosine phosphorylase [Thermofilum sp. ex4484_79]|nr:MAG: 5'-methylthioadenosine phosphorylase [Thermofilum sp. ex4484_79]
MCVYHKISHIPFHILAKPEDISPRVLVVGDPLRAERLANALLKDHRLVNRNRYFLTYTGYYNGRNVTIGTHGIGAPSAAIVFEELRMLGAEIIVRLGTAGSLSDEIDVGTIFIPYGAAYEYGGTLGMYFGSTCMPAVPDFQLTLEIKESIMSRGLSIAEGIVVSSDSFHGEEKYAEKWREIGLKAVEMECATLFTLSRYKGFKSAAALLIIDNVFTGKILDSTLKEKYEKLVASAVLDVISKY